MKQSDVFLAGEGVEWFRRNESVLGEHDPVSGVIESIDPAPTSVLEIGASIGWRLQRLSERQGCKVAGIDPAGLSNFVLKGAAHDLGAFPDGRFDLVIFGFCLYLVDPQDYFRAVAESDRVLADGGYLVIHDFFQGPDQPWRTPYRHCAGVWSHHAAFERLWLAHPAYRKVSTHLPADRPDEAVHVLRKDALHAFEQRDGGTHDRPDGASGAS